MFAAYVVDRAVNGKAWAKRFDDAVTRYERHCGTIIRVAVGILFLTLWNAGDTILYAGAEDHQQLYPVAATGYSGLDVIPLHAAARRRWHHGPIPLRHMQYGAFHMMDYPVIPGIAVFLGLANFKSPHVNALRLSVLYASVAATMMWGAIEKFGYPCWTLPLMDRYPNLMLGLGFDRFMDVAGFVEFSLAFFMVTGRHYFAGLASHC